VPQKHFMLGQAAVYRVAAELLMRDIHPFFPSVDDGVDLFTEQGHAIQVKAASRSKELRYHFNFRHWAKRDGRRVQVPNSIGPKVTHIVLWGVEDDAFWIIPAKFCQTTKHISVPSLHQNGRSRFNSCVSKWEYLSQKAR